MIKEKNSCLKIMSSKQILISVFAFSGVWKRAIGTSLMLQRRLPMHKEKEKYHCKPLKSEINKLAY